MWELIETLNIPTPKATIVNNIAALEKSLSNFNYPLILKPNSSAFGFDIEKKAIILRSDEDTKQVQEIWNSDHKMILQDYIDGQRVSCNLVSAGGKMISYRENIATLTDERDGTGRTLCTVSREPTPLLQDHSKKILEELNFTGFFNLQFIYDSVRKDYYFLEINPRLPATSSLLYELGVDIDGLAFDLFVDNKSSLDINKPDESYSRNISCYWLGGDIRSTRKYLKEVRLA